MKSNLVYNVVYENLLYCLFIFLGPLLVITVLNACLVRELIIARRRRRSHQMPLCCTGSSRDTTRSSWYSGRGPGIGANGGNDSGEQNLTLVMVIIVLIFVVCQTPAFANQILFSLIGREQYECGKVCIVTSLVACSGGTRGYHDLGKHSSTMGVPSYISRSIV